MTTEKQESVELVSESGQELEPESPQPVTTTRKRNKWRLMLGAIALFAGGVIAWRFIAGSQPSSQEVENNAEATLTVKSVPVKLEPIQAWTYGDGTVIALTKKHLTFQAEGTITYIKKVNGRDLREGDLVRRGELLARVDRRKYDADVTVAAAGQIEAKNQVINAVASLKQAEESLAQAQADLKKAKTDEAFAETDLRRYVGLAKEGAIEQREVELKRANYQNAQAGVIASEAGVRSAQAQVDAAKTQVQTAEAGVSSASARLTQSNVDREDTVIVAPFDGIVARLNIREGEYWTPQLVNVAGDYQNIIERLPIIVIAPNQFEVEVELPAFQGEQVKPGQRAFVILDRDRSKANSGSITGEELRKLASARGRVFSVSPSVSPGERSVRVTIRINEGFANIQDGEQVSAWIATQEKIKTTVAPFNAFVFRDSQPYVFVINEEKGVVEQRKIQQGIEGLAKREILAGVEPGEKLVTDGKNRLVNGAPVEIIEK